jgi:hypothetical protein
MTTSLWSSELTDSNQPAKLAPSSMNRKKDGR